MSVRGASRRGRHRGPVGRRRIAAAHRGDRGVVLLLVVVVVTISALAGGWAAAAAASERGSAVAAREVAQARAAAWSGIQAVMAELSAQREALLAGERPVVTESWELSVEGSLRGGRDRCVVRLVELGRDGPLVPEGGLLDINSASVDSLYEVGFSREVASSIVSGRRDGPYGSVEELLRVPGVRPAMLERGASGGTGDEPVGGTGLGGLLTVFSFDPNIQAGLGDGAEQFRGRQRINLNQPMGDGLRSALAERLGSEAAAAGVERVIRDGTGMRSGRDIVAALRRLGVPPEGWAPVLDIFTTREDAYLPGRIDLRTAPARVLESLPGVDEAMAREIVAARERMAMEAQASATWLVTEGIMGPSVFEGIVDLVTTRCMQWRVRVEAGLARADGAGPGIGGPVSGAAAGGGLESLDLRPRVVLEAVIDVASQRPRVAYLRDVTLLEASVLVLGDPGLVESLGLGAEAGGELGADEAVGPSEDSGDPSGSADAVADWRRVERPGPVASPRAAMGPGFGRWGGGPTDGGFGPDASGGGAGVGPPGSAGGDPRIGRWTTGGGAPGGGV